MKNVLTIIHPEGWRFIGIFGFVAFILYLLGNQIGHFWGDIGFVLTAWCVYFFRNPERVTPTRPGLIVSPADGKIVAIKEVTPPKELMLEGGPRTRISIFLNVFDVHVNRIPIEGTIIQSLYHPGKFFNASLDKASEHNERQTLVIELEDKKDLAVVQIAGLIARRIRCDVGEDEKVLSGQRYGIIRFGSRADVYLPLGVNALVVEGQRTVGGETILADLESLEDNRQGGNKLTPTNNQPDLVIVSRKKKRLPAAFKKRGGRLKQHSLASMLPNITTVLALSSGLTSVRFAMMERWELAILAIFLAGFLDAMDGRLARYLGSSSRFGAELDSFSDFISFGASPALIVYLRSLHLWGGVGWGIILFFTVCMALRLARFNVVSIEGSAPAWSQSYFTGVPAPAAAMLALTPLIMDLHWGGKTSIFLHPIFSAVILLTVSLLMVSRVPTFSLKKVSVPHKFVLPLMLVAAILVVALYSEPWLTLSLLAVIYVLTIPFSILSCKRLEKEAKSAI